MQDAALGSTLGNYRFDRLLGEGGMGRVYAATQLQTGRIVAIKVIGEEHAREPELVGRFYAEAHAASRIHHRSIIEVLELVYLPDGRPAIVMELVEGPTLRELITAGPMPLDTALDVIAQVLDAIAAAHAAGIVHRDLKPDNIVVMPSGVAKVLDFGIAKLASGETVGQAPRTRTGMMLGTPDYMAPEQIMGGTIDGRTDVYAMGVVLYEALTGRRPFDGDSQFMLLRAHLEMPAPYASDIRPDVPAELSRVAMQAMAKSPDERFPTPTAMRDALRDSTRSTTGMAIASGAYVAAPASLTPAPIARPSSQRGLVITSIVALFVLAIGIGWIIRHRRLTSPTTASVPASPRPAAPTGSTAPTAPTATTVQPPTSSLPPGATSAGDDWARYPAPAKPERFDFDAVRDEMIARARVQMPDAHLFNFQVRPVRSDGTLDLASTSVSMIFSSPAVAATRPASMPPNEDYRAKCQVVVNISTVMVQVSRGVDRCVPPKAAPPTCTVKQIWERAQKKGAKPIYSAEISFVDGKWDFYIYNVPAKDEKSLHFDDNC